MERSYKLVGDHGDDLMLPVFTDWANHHGIEDAVKRFRSAVYPEQILDWLVAYNAADEL